jgi:hypothetical protein
MVQVPHAMVSPQHWPRKSWFRLNEIACEGHGSTCTAAGRKCETQKRVSSLQHSVFITCRFGRGEGQMGRGMGMGSMARASHSAVSLTAAILVSGVAFGWMGKQPAFAAEGATPAPSRYSETDLLDAARRAATATESRTVNIGMPPPDELRVLEARREAELKRLSDKLKRAADARGTKALEVITQPEWATEVVAAPADGLDLKQRSALGAQSETVPTSSSPDFGLKGRATVLMVLAASDGRPLHPERAADPILCLLDGCYVSNGPQAQASYHAFNQSLSFSGRIGRGAGACNHARTCVFRDVDLGTGTTLVQPINLKLVRHDRREQRDVSIDQTCKLIDGRLSCSRPVRTSTYTLWVVPEHVAREIGSDKLADAVSDGLLTSRTAELPWMPQRSAQQ